jgi:hypothetical protein
MKINEINNEQWEIKESGIATIVIGAFLAGGGVLALAWILTHLATIAWWWSLVGLGALAIGGLIIFSASSRQLVLRRQGLTEIVTTRVIGGKQTSSSFDAGQIASVNLDTTDELKTSTASDGDQTTTRERSSVLYVLLRDNSQVILATRKGGSNGLAVNGMGLNGINKAPLADEAQRIATFYGVVLSSRANNMTGIQAVTSVLNTMQQGITQAPQPAGGAPTQTITQPQPIVPDASAPIPPVVVLVAPPVQNTDASQTPSAMPEVENTGEQPLR